MVAKKAALESPGKAVLAAQRPILTFHAAVDEEVSGGSLPLGHSPPSLVPLRL
jgi:hypothetical protein